jgi:hypothetical protein
VFENNVESKSSMTVGLSKKSSLLVLLTIITLILVQRISGNTFVQSCKRAVQWKVEEGGNGHWYAGVRYDSWLTWQTAKLQAEKLGGYLATVGSQEEFQFVFDLAGDIDLWIQNSFLSGPDHSFLAGPWLGGFQDKSAVDYSEPLGGWRWITGEPWFEHGWAGSEPSNCCGGEEWLHFITFKAIADRKWNDLYEGTDVVSSIIEWNTLADCNDNSIIDRCEISMGAVTDYDNNGIPDSCKSSPNTTAIIPEVLLTSARWFFYPECIENHTWEQISRSYQTVQSMLSSGGLGPLETENFQVWACFQGHLCLERVEHLQANDAMCYVYHEIHETWHPLSLKSELQTLCSHHGNFSHQNSEHKPSPLWVSKQGQVDEYTGFFPNSQHMENTIVMALEFPSSPYLQPHQHYSDSAQWILTYGQHGEGSQHWIWHGASLFDEETTSHVRNSWRIGVWSRHQIYHFNNSDNGDKIPGGQLITICTVTQSDGKFMVYVNSSLQDILIFNDEHIEQGDSFRLGSYFSYTSSRMVLGSNPSTYLSPPFAGVIHETRLYNTSMSAQEVLEVNDELHNLYRR